jgi:hypothetical protein
MPSLGFENALRATGCGVSHIQAATVVINSDKVAERSHSAKAHAGGSVSRGIFLADLELQGLLARPRVPDLQGARIVARNDGIGERAHYAADLVVAHLEDGTERGGAPCRG